MIQTSQSVSWIPPHTGLVEKIGDIKLNRQVTTTLLAIADAISLNFTSANACIYAEKQKSPKVHTEVITVITWLSVHYRCHRFYGYKLFLLLNTNWSIRTKLVDSAWHKAANQNTVLTFKWHKSSNQNTLKLPRCVSGWRTRSRCSEWRSTSSRTSPSSRCV